MPEYKFVQHFRQILQHINYKREAFSEKECFRLTR